MTCSLGHQREWMEGFCMGCIEQAEADIAAGHFYSVDEAFTALRENREPLCNCGKTHPNDDKEAVA